jgi:putative transposase
MNLRVNNHTVSNLTAHIVFVTKYRYSVLKWWVQLRVKELIKQICDSEDVKIIKWVVSKDHIHIHIEYEPKLSISELVKKIKWRTSKKIQEEFPEIWKRYWWRHFWTIWYWVWNTWVISEDLINEYLEHHRNLSNFDTDNFILE